MVISVYLKDPAIQKRLEALAKKLDRSLSWVAEEAIKDYLERYEEAVQDQGRKPSKKS